MTFNIVFGGGLAGLNAALFLAETTPEPVIILEKEPYVGGLSATIHWKGTRLDFGPHRIFTQIPGVQEQIEDLLEPELIQVKRLSHMYLGGRFIDYPPKVLQMMMALGPMKLFGWGMGLLRQKIRSKHPRNKKENYEQYIIGQFGRGLYRDFFLPYTKKVWGAEPSTLSSDIVKTRVASKSVFSTIINRSRKQPTTVKQFPYPKHGIGCLAESLAGRIREKGGEIRLDSEPKSIVISDGAAVRIHGRDSAKGEDFSIDAARVVSTIPLGTLLNLLGEPENPADTLEYVNLRLVYLMLDVPRVGADTWLYFPEEDVPFSRAYEVGNFSPDCVPEGKSVLCIEVPQTPAEVLPDDELISEVIASLKKIGLIEADQIEDTMVFDVPKAYPLYRVNYGDTIREILTKVGQYHNVVTTGRQGLFAYNNLDHSLFIGKMAAERLLEGPESVRKFYQQRDSLCQYQIVD